MSNDLVRENPVVANRRRQLQRWIDELFDGNQSAFGASTADGQRQINQGELSALLNTKAEKLKSFGEKRARSLELQAHMPAGYLDSTSSPNARTLSPFVVAHSPTDQASGSRNFSWPFVLVSFKRLSALRADLGPKSGTHAIHDIDKYLDVAVSKWEKEAEAMKKKRANR